MKYLKSTLDHKTGFTPTPISHNRYEIMNQHNGSNFSGNRHIPEKIGVSLQSKRGFTLIELLVVISIIGILASIVLASMNQARAKARDASRLSAIKELQKALALYADSDPDNNYPAATQDDPFNVYYTSINGNSTHASLKNALAPYMSSLPSPNLFTNSNKSGATMSRISYSRIKNYPVVPFFGICPGVTAQGKCYALLIYTETATTLGPAETAIYLFSDGQKMTGYNINVW